MSHWKVSWGAALPPAATSAAAGASLLPRAPGAPDAAAAAAAADAPPPPASLRKRKAVSDDDGMDASSAASSPASSSPPQSSRPPPRASVVERRGAIAPAKRLRLVWDHAESARVGGSPSTSSSAAATPASLLVSSDSSNNTHASINNNQERTVPLRRILETLSKENLLNLLKSLLSNDQMLSERTAALLPRPTLESASAHLKSAVADVEARLPYSTAAGGVDRSSDYAFGRVRKQLASLMEILSLYLTHFTEPCSYPPHLAHEYPHESFCFLDSVSRAVIPRLPYFHSDARNEEAANEAYRLVARAYRVAIAECCRRIRIDGRLYPVHTVHSWLRALYSLRDAVDGKFGFAEAVDEFVKGEIGWIVLGVQSTGFHAMQQQQQNQQQEHLGVAANSPFFGSGGTNAAAGNPEILAQFQGNGGGLVVGGL
ncbi:Tethering factor for nuclear proteasome sts1 [Entophlyctis luteolus]|nr:Tethering factor for nuclear proteasome sts1 [Entophlyctis luteolus]KAJ3391061.1 Tethering factor for nuclear proteasome sts1 [Entophlyctis sp. JEL0112]